MKLLFAGLLSLFFIQANNAYAQKHSRPTGIIDTVYEHATTWDSVHFSYSLPADTFYPVSKETPYIAHDTSAGFHFEPGSLFANMHVQKFDTATRKLLLQTNYGYDTANGWYKTGADSFEYDNTGTLSKIYNVLYNDVVYSSVSCTYNKLGQLTIRIGYDSSGIYTDRTEYAYNSDGNMVLKKEYSWNTNNLSFWLYNQSQWKYSGNLLDEEITTGFSGNTVDNITRKTYKYDSAGLQTSDSACQWDLYHNYWWPLYTENFHYDTGNNMVCKVLRSYHIFTGNVDGYTVDSNYYDQNHNAVHTITRFYDSAFSFYTNYLQTFSEFNSYHQPTVVYNETWNHAANKWDHGTSLYPWVTHYFYEEYEPLQAENNTRFLNKTEFELYPNPATGYVFIRLPDESTPVYSIDITDISGHIVKQWMQKNTPGKNIYVSLAGIPPGTYIMHISGSSNPGSRKFIISR